MALAVLVAGVPDDLPGQREQLVPPGQHSRGQTADLGSSLVYRHLAEGLGSIEQRVLRLSA